MNTILIASILMISLFFLLLGRKKAISQKVARLPSPPRLPFIGNLLQVDSTNSHRSLYKLSKEHGPLMLLHFGTVQTLVVSSPKIAEEVIKNNDLAFSSRPTSKVLNTLSYNHCDIGLAQYGESWRQMRRVAITYLLGSNKVKSFSSDRTEAVSLLLKKVDVAASKVNQVICVTEILESYVANVITRVILGSWISEEKKRHFIKLSHDTIDWLSLLCIEEFFPMLKWLDVLRGFNGKLKNHFKNWDALLEEVIKEHSNNSREANGKNCIYLIDALLELQNDSSLGFVFTRVHIKAIIKDLINAGGDTTSAALDWCMVELIRNPGVMMKVKDEIRGIAKGEDMISEEHLGQMSYLKAFVKEVLRLHPPSPLLIPRESFQDCQILGYNIPKKTRLIFNAWAFGRDESYWEAAEQLKPERFLGSTKDYIGKDFNFMPFGAGRRICPGMHSAKVIIELALANLLHRFDWTLPSSITSEHMDMEETGGITSRRKQKLELVPIACKVN